MRRSLAPVAVLLPLLVPAGAEAATRYVTPSGSGAACTTAAPCAIATGVGGAGAGDEVQVAPGDYGSASTPLTIGLSPSGAGIDIHGVAGQPRPRIFTTADYGVTISSPATHVSHLQIEAVRSSGVGQIGLAVTAATTGSPSPVVVDDVVVRRVGGTGYACLLGGVGKNVLRNSTCWSDAANVSALGLVSALWGPTDAVVRNSTLWSAGSANGVYVASSSGRSVQLQFVNTILHGGAGDLYAAVNSTPVTVAATHSAYDPTKVLLVGGATGPNAADNFAAPPVLVSPSTGDLRQQAASPTVDAGVDDDADGPFALGGTLPRILGAATDVGADELAPPPTSTTTAADGVTPSVASLHGTVSTGRLPGSAHFEYGTSTAYGSSTPDSTVAAGSAGSRSVAADLTGLSASTTYHARLVVTTAGGTATGSDVTFTTGAPPVGGGGTGGGGTGGGTGGGGTGGGTEEQAAPKLSGVRLARTVRIGRATTLQLALDRAATVRIALVRLDTGVRRGARCLTPGSNRKGRRCTRTTTLRVRTSNLRGGSSKVRLSASFLGHRPGRYRVVVRPSAGGRPGAEVSRSLRLRR
ncbi:hypothetical protein [Patulibacter minatonensis]|uniref:hypothetical protein n=1 Tax=Patulibacter minatonensis TaxID=298163 RepID=UPI000479F9C5|nr:hypothetical protein [Patulibacter minatonensis]